MKNYQRSGSVDEIHIKIYKFFPSYIFCNSKKGVG